MVIKVTTGLVSNGRETGNRLERQGEWGLGSNVLEMSGDYPGTNICTKRFSYFNVYMLYFNFNF